VATLSVIIKLVCTIRYTRELRKELTGDLVLYMHAGHGRHSLAGGWSNAVSVMADSVGD